MTSILWTRPDGLTYLSSSGDDQVRDGAARRSAQPKAGRPRVVLLAAASSAPTMRRRLEAARAGAASSGRGSARETVPGMSLRELRRRPAGSSSSRSRSGSRGRSAPTWRRSSSSCRAAAARRRCWPPTRSGTCSRPRTRGSTSPPAPGSRRRLAYRARGPLRPSARRRSPPCHPPRASLPPRPELAALHPLHAGAAGRGGGAPGPRLAPWP